MIFVHAFGFIQFPNIIAIAIAIFICLHFQKLLKIIQTTTEPTEFTNLTMFHNNDPINHQQTFNTYIHSICHKGSTRVTL